ncbi:hypothetical protein UACE39S_02903 [Ureibacillus acetophenoni]|uniref:aspartyl-phosphate phosphatase Spo0E family protein n=1 Tax=Ureibacillus sp. MALMAid1270 TaxID=3411629 RepID=UPI003BA6828F
MNTIMLPHDEVQLKIEEIRYQMIHTGQLKGLAHPDTIKLSQELDLLMNEYQKIQKEMAILME